MNKIDLFVKSQSATVKEKISKNFSDSYFRDSVVRLVLGIGLIFLALAWVFSIFYFKISSYEVPIRYNSFFGVTTLGSWYDLYRFPLFLTLSFIVNTILSKAIYKKDKLVSYILTSTNILLGIIILVLIINFGKLLG